MQAEQHMSVVLRIHHALQGLDAEPHERAHIAACASALCVAKQVTPDVFGELCRGTMQAMQATVTKVEGTIGAGAMAHMHDPTGDALCVVVREGRAVQTLWVDPATAVHPERYRESLTPKQRRKVAAKLLSAAVFLLEEG